MSAAPPLPETFSAAELAAINRHDTREAFFDRVVAWGLAAMHHCPALADLCRARVPPGVDPLFSFMLLSYHDCLTELLRQCSGPAIRDFGPGHPLWPRVAALLGAA